MHDGTKFEKRCPISMVGNCFYLSARNSKQGYSPGFREIQKSMLESVWNEVDGHETLLAAFLEKQISILLVLNLMRSRPFLNVNLENNFVYSFLCHLFF